MQPIKTFIVILSRQIRVRVQAESEYDAMRAALHADSEGDHLVQWVDAAVAGATAVEQKEEQG